MNFSPRQKKKKKSSVTQIAENENGNNLGAIYQT